MNALNKSAKLLTVIITSSFFASSAIAGGGCGGGGSKPEKVARYKTPQMVVFVNSTISHLNSIENPNERHLKVLTNCQRTFNSGKKSARGMEAKNLKSCKNLMSKGGYDVKKIASNLSEDQIKKNSERPVAFEKESNYKKEKITKTIDSSTENNSDLLLF